MLILVLIFICSFIQIDAVGEVALSKSLFGEPTEERAHQPLSDSFNALLAERERASNEGRADEFTPALNSVLDWYEHVRYNDPEYMTDVLREITRAYDRLNPLFAQRHVTMPPLDQLHTNPTIDLSQFRRDYLDANGTPRTDIDRAIFIHSFPQLFNILLQEAPQRLQQGENQIHSPYRSPILRAADAAPRPAGAARRRLFQDDLEPLVNQEHDPLTPPNRRRAREEDGEEGEPNRRVRRRLDFGDNVPAINIIPHNQNPDDENGPNGGGIAVN